MKALATSMILLLLTVATGAEEAAKPAIPAAYPEGRYGAAWSKNPFLLRVKHPEQTQADVLRDWALNGMAEYDGKVQVTIVNKQTGEFKRLTNHDGADAEFRLIKANFNRNRSDASVAIEKDGQTATLKYSLTK